MLSRLDRLRRKSTVANEPEVDIYITGLSTPLSVLQITKLNRFVKRIKAGYNITNLSDVFDTLYVRAGETQESALKNLVKDAHHSTAVNSPTWEANKGFTGANTKYLNTNFNPAASGVNYKLNDCSYGVFSLTNKQSYCDMGVRTASGTNRTFYYIRDAYNNTSFFVNTNSSGLGVSNDSGIGLFVATRDNDTKQKLNKNGGAMGERTANSNALANYNFFEHALDTAGSATASVYGTNTIAFSFHSRALTKIEVKILREAIDAYFNETINTLVDDCAHCWFTTPMAVSDGTKSYVGLVHDSDGLGYTQHILQMNNDGTNKVVTKVGQIYNNDDHDEPSIIIRPDGRLFIAYTEHNDNSVIKFRVSTNPNDATIWGTEGTFTAPNLCSYASSFQAENGDIYIFYREYPEGYSYIKSTDGGLTFSGRVNFYFGFSTRGYAKFRQHPTNKNIIHAIVSSTHPEEATGTSLYAFYFDAENDTFHSLTGTDITANKPFNAATYITPLMVNTTPNTGWIEDLIVLPNGDTRYAIAHYPDGDVSPYRKNKELWYCECVSGVVSTPVKVHTETNLNIVGDAPTSAYMPNASFDVNNPDVIIASKDSGNTLELYKLTRVDNSTFTTVQLTSHPYYGKWRPNTIKGNAGKAIALVKYGYGHYTSFYQSLILIDA